MGVCVRYNLACEVVVHSCLFKLVPPDRRVDTIESIGEINKHDPHSVPMLLQVRQSLMEEEDDTVNQSISQSIKLNFKNP